MAAEVVPTDSWGPERACWTHKQRSSSKSKWKWNGMQKVLLLMAIVHRAVFSRRWLLEVDSIDLCTIQIYIHNMCR